MRPLSCLFIALLFASPARAELLEARFQRGLESLARGQQTREESAGTASEAAGHAAAIEHLRAAVRGLSETAAMVERQLVERRLRPAAQLPEGAKSVGELESLQSNIALQLARARRQLGLCYPPRSPDRDDALLQAAAGLEPLAQHPGPDELEWNARLEWIACQQELGRLQPALERLQAWSRDDPPPALAVRLAAQLVRLYVAAGRIEEALDIAGRQPPRGTTDKDALGEFALAGLEARLAQWQRDGEDSGNRGGGDLTDWVDAIGRDYGPYWGRRAQLLAGRVLAIGGPASDARSLLLAAENLYHNGRLDEAIVRFDQAAAAFDQQRQFDQALAAAMSAAAVERAAGRSMAAADRYRRCAFRHLNHHRAAEAHRLAILALADALRDSADGSQQAALADAYQQLLTEHLHQWPDSATADDVRFWLGRLLASRGEWSAARGVLAEIEPSAERFAAAIELTIDGYERELRQHRAAAEDTADEARRRQAALLAAATTQLQPIITGAENRWPDSWSALQRKVAVALARMHLEFPSAASPHAERLLAAALRDPPAEENDDDTAAWEATARSLLVVALARNGKPAEAQATVQQLLRSGPAELMEMLARLHAVMDDVPPGTPQRRELGQLVLEVVRALDAHQPYLDGADARRLNQYRAAGLAATDQRAAALIHLAELAAASPDDGALQEQYAALLAAGDSHSELRNALARWQAIEERSRPGTPRWNRARQARIDLLQRLGQPEEAEKLRRLTRLLYPDWDGTTQP